MGRKKRQVILPPTFVGAQPSRPGASAPGGNVPNSVGPILDGFKSSAINAMKIADDLAKAAFLESLSALSGRLEQEVVVVRQELGGAQQSNIESLQGEIAARSVLLERKTIDLGRQQEQANSYYGSSPFGKSAEHYAGATFQNIATGRIRVANIQEALNAAYRAAYMVQLREAEIQMLQAQIAAQQQALHTAQEQLRAEAEAQARAQAEAETAARAQAEAEAAARAQADAEAAARAQAEAETQVNAQAAAERALAEQAMRQANTYRVPLSELAAKPAVVMATATAPVLEAGVALGTAIRSAVASLSVASIEAVAGSFLVGSFALLYAPKLGDGELTDNYVLTSPLTDLLVELDGAAQAAALELGTVDLPVRMGDKREQVGSIELFAANTEGAVIPSTVPVLAAAYDAQSGQYTVITDDIPPRTLTWTPAVEQDSSTTLPANPPSGTVLVGPMLEPIEGRLDAYPELPDFGFDDYVIIFPADSGLPPLYVMFKSLRNKPGVVSGNGVLHEGPLLVEGNESGAAIPTSIADELRGKSFSSFDAFRRQLWKLIADSTYYSGQFDEAALHMMSKGLAPLAFASEQVGGRIKYEIHHKIKIVEGGAVYDVDNIVIVSPKFHIDFHRKG